MVCIILLIDIQLRTIKICRYLFSMRRQWISQVSSSAGRIINHGLLFILRHYDINSFRSPAFHPLLHNITLLAWHSTPIFPFSFSVGGIERWVETGTAWEGRGWVCPSRPPRDNFFLLRLYRARIYAGRRINAWQICSYYEEEAEAGWKE